MSCNNSKESLSEVVSDYGLEVPYSRGSSLTSVGHEAASASSPQSGDETESPGSVGRGDDQHQIHLLSASQLHRRCLLSCQRSSFLNRPDDTWVEMTKGTYGDSRYQSGESSRKSILGLKKKLADYLRSVAGEIKVAFNVRVLSKVSFQREDNVKHEMELKNTTYQEDLSYEHFLRLRDAFLVHSGSKGYLTKNQLRSCLKTLGHNPTDQQLWAFMAKVDVDHSGTLDFDEFVDLMSSMMAGWDTVTDLGICWRVLDAKGRGTICVEDLRHLLTTFGAEMSEPELDELFHGLEARQRLHFEEFHDAVVLPVWEEPRPMLETTD